MKQPKIISANLCDEETLARVAYVMGSHSTSQAVLNELTERRAAGETVCAYNVVTARGTRLESTILVLDPAVVN